MCFLPKISPRNWQGRLRTNFYDKSNDFPIVNFLFVSSTCIWSVYFSINSLIRACAFYQDLNDRGLQFTRKLLSQGFSGKVKSHHLESFRSLSWFGWMVWNIHFTNEDGYLPTVVNTNLFLYQLWLTSIVTIYWLWLLTNTMRNTIGAGVAYPSGAPWFL